MNAATVLFIICLSIIAIVGTIALVATNFERIIVFVLRAINAPVYLEARMVAALIYQRPAEWQTETYAMVHPKVGKLRATIAARSVELSGPFGEWEPNFIERQIIWDAVVWYRTHYTKAKLTAFMRAS